MSTIIHAFTNMTRNTTIIARTLIAVTYYRALLLNMLVKELKEKKRVKIFLI